MLPDSDPEDKWDEELEEGETILAIDFMQAILICTHHANDLATKANAEKKTKMFERQSWIGAETSTTCSTKTILMNSLNQRHGTMQSNSSPT